MKSNNTNNTTISSSICTTTTNCLVPSNGTLENNNNNNTYHQKQTFTTIKEEEETKDDKENSFIVTTENSVNTTIKDNVVNSHNKTIIIEHHHHYHYHNNNNNSSNSTQTPIVSGNQTNNNSGSTANCASTTLTIQNNNNNIASMRYISVSKSTDSMGSYTTSTLTLSSSSSSSSVLKPMLSSFSILLESTKSDLKDCPTSKVIIDIVSDIKVIMEENVEQLEIYCNNTTNQFYELVENFKSMNLENEQELIDMVNSSIESIQVCICSGNRVMKKFQQFLDKYEISLEKIKDILTSMKEKNAPEVLAMSLLTLGSFAYKFIYNQLTNVFSKEQVVPTTIEDDHVIDKIKNVVQELENSVSDCQSNQKLVVNVTSQFIDLKQSLSLFNSDIEMYYENKGGSLTYGSIVEAPMLVNMQSCNEIIQKIKILLSLHLESEEKELTKLRQFKLRGLKKGIKKLSHSINFSPKKKRKSTVK
ncbi:hypothetical protein CYY_003315 [Polysphondylium violaceum]|uniref:Uncharacterized protein n=1 Tax=Polysphondylium violaceum TaxID=133409 RepID=A0A8J4UUE5_9MYCE|nr:hypothetical protein CYY_003315 [Polysphondylium violaceum]